MAASDVWGLPATSTRGTRYGRPPVYSRDEIVRAAKVALRALQSRAAAGSCLFARANGPVDYVAKYRLGDFEEVGAANQDCIRSQLCQLRRKLLRLPGIAFRETYPIAMLPPSVQPSFCRPSRSAFTHDWLVLSFSAVGKSRPIRRLCLNCCPFAATGHAAAPPSAAMNSRRLVCWTDIQTLKRRRLHLPCAIFSIPAPCPGWPPPTPDVSFGSFADIAAALTNVCFTPDRTIRGRDGTVTALYAACPSLELVASLSLKLETSKTAISGCGASALDEAIPTATVRKCSTT
jgi:hypothetical protein